MVFEEEIEIKKEHTDENGLLRPDALAKLLQRVADDQLRPLGLSGDDLRSRGYMWVITRRYAEIERMPKLGEVLMFKTWTGQTRHGLYPRYHKVTDKAGRAIINVACQWVTIDAKNRELAQSLDFLEKMPSDKYGDELRLPKPVRNWPGSGKTAVHKAVPAEIDENGHVNNCFYIGWAYGLLKRELESLQRGCGVCFGGADEGLRIDYSNSSFCIDYKKEVMEGENLELQYGFGSSEENGAGISEPSPLTQKRCQQEPSPLTQKTGQGEPSPLTPFYVRGCQDGNTNFDIIIKGKFRYYN